MSRKKHNVKEKSYMYVRELQLKNGEKFESIDVRESSIKGFVRIETLDRHKGSPDFAHFEIVHYNKDLIAYMVYEQEWEEEHNPYKVVKRIIDKQQSKEQITKNNEQCSANL